VASGGRPFGLEAWRSRHLARSAIGAVAEHLEPRRLLATIFWDGGPEGTGTNFHDPVNWAGDVLPGPGDDAVISVAGNPTITITQNASVRSITSDEAIAQSAGTLTLAAASVFNAAYSLTGGEMTGAGNYEFAGGLVFHNALMRGTGVATIPSGQVLTLGGGSNQWRLVSRTLEVLGTVEWTANDLYVNGSLAAVLPPGGARDGPTP
jgi:hypothetical protein